MVGGSVADGGPRRLRCAIVTLTQSSHDLRAASGGEITVLKPAGGWTRLELADLWRYRDLLYILAWRDVKVRYKQATLGIAWTVLQPLLLVGLFTFVFTRIGGGFKSKLPAGVPYPVFAFTGLLPWLVFATIVPSSANSIVSNSALVSKVYFPRLVIPLGSVVARIPDFLISAIMLLVIMGIYGFAPPNTGLLLPVIMVASMLAAASLGIWFSALNVAYRDVQYVVPFLIQAGMFFTPIAYPTSSVPASLQWLPALNPMTWVINVARWSLLGSSIPVAVSLESAGTMCVLLVTGLYYFRKVQNFFADVV
jgi:lipopolysaccharide transport system permease protein